MLNELQNLNAVADCLPEALSAGKSTTALETTASRLGRVEVAAPQIIPGMIAQISHTKASSLPVKAKERAKAKEESGARAREESEE